ncbi:MAG: phosphatidate cytidylyltransferase [Pseudomonadota bacterium]
MLKERVITALILLPLVLWCVFGGVAMAFPIFAAAIILAAAWEWTAMMRLTSLPARLGFVALVAAMLWHVKAQALAVDAADMKALGPLMAGTSVFWLAALVWVRRYPADAQRWDRPFLMLAIGLLLLVPTWAGLVQLHGQSPWWLMYVLLLVWGADTGAYFAGRRFGKVKLAPAVSPAKTREGLYGGLLTTALIMLAVAFYLKLAGLQFLLFAAASAVTVLASVLGDLFESMIKRRAGIKDSGKIFPGHGGALDRIDSITAAAPVFLTGWWLAGGF